jgi:hypothetical protein
MGRSRGERLPGPIPAAPAPGTEERMAPTLDLRELTRGNRLRWLLGGVALGLLVVVLARPFRARPEAAPPPAPPPLPALDLARLEEVEQRERAPILPDQERQHDEVLAYWWSANETLFTRLAAWFQQPERERPRLTCILAPGGGAEHLHRLLQFQGGARVCRIDAGDRLRRNPYVRRALEVEELPSLHAREGPPLARLPGVREPEAFGKDALALLLHGSEQDALLPDDALVLLEGLETLHPATSAAILDAIARESGSGGRGFLVLGPSDAFAPWLRARAGDPSPPTLEVLAPPRLRTAGDVGYLARASLALEHGRWPEEFEVKSLQDLVVRHGFLAGCVGHPFLWRQLNEHSVLLAGRREADVREWLLQKLLERGERLLGRGAERDGAWARALEEAAARTAERVDGEGYFVLEPEEHVAMHWSSGPLHVRTAELLERSGCAEQDLAAGDVPRYRFTPPWLHGHLARAWLRRELRLRGAEERGPLAAGDRGRGPEPTPVRAMLDPDELPPPAEQLGGPRARLSHPPR